MFIVFVLNQKIVLVKARLIVIFMICYSLAFMVFAFFVSLIQNLLPRRPNWIWLLRQKFSHKLHKIKWDISWLSFSEILFVIINRIDVHFSVKSLITYRYMFPSYLIRGMQFYFLYLKLKIIQLDLQIVFWLQLLFITIDNDRTKPLVENLCALIERR